MKAQFRHRAGALVAIIGLALGSCQRPPATTTPAARQAQAAPSPTVAPTPTATPNATPTVGRSAEATPIFKVLWVYQSEGAVWGTPAVDQGTVYFGSDDGNLYAVDAQSGQRKWQFATQGIVRSRPAVAAGQVYFTSDDGYLYALDAQKGMLTWRADIGNATPRSVRERLGSSTSPLGYDYLQSSPVVAQGQVYAGSADGSVCAVGAGTGKVTWTYKTGGQVRAAPTVDNGTVYVGSWDKAVYALDALTGQLRWQTPIGGQVQTTALVAGGMVYCASRKASVVALDTQTGTLKWEHSYGYNMWVESSPRLVAGILYIGSSGSRFILGLDSRTGDVITTYQGMRFYWSTPAIADNTLYIGSTNVPNNPAGLCAFRLVDGKFSGSEQAQRELSVEQNLPVTGGWTGVASSPVLLEGTIYFGGLDGRLYAVTD